MVSERLRKAVFAGTLISASVLSFGAKAHHAREGMPVVLAERLITLLEDARKAQRFNATLPAACTPEVCLRALLAGLTETDMQWLNEAPEAEIPSARFGRLPASLTYKFLNDLQTILPEAARDTALSEQALRLKKVLSTWTD